MNMFSLDHLVINTRFNLDSYRAFFSRLGFTVTPKSHHSLGSVNHLIVFQDTYLELIGLERDGPVRKDIMESRMGIDGLVLKMDEEKAVLNGLEKAGLRAMAPQRFNRLLENGEKAEFLAVRLEPGQFAEGRVYFCRHLTPELVWQPGHMTHPNGVSGIGKLTIAAADPDMTREAYGRLGKLKGIELDICDLEEARKRFGLQSVQPDRFLAITFTGADLHRLSGFLLDAKVSYFFVGESLLVPLKDGSVLEFES